MFLAQIVLAAALGQCPDPPSRYGPPPCAAANVPGCLPGYRRSLDAHGRTIYVCARAAAPAPAPLPGPPEPDVGATPPPSYEPAPQYSARYPFAPPPAPGYLGNRGMIGLVLTPGASTIDRGHTGEATGAVALELRGPVGGARLRAGYEFSREVHAAEIGIKYDFFDRLPVRPFLALGVGAASQAKDPGWGPSGSVSAGLDLYLLRDIFATIEVKQRAFTRDTSNGFEISSVHQTSVYAGLGLYF